MTVSVSNTNINDSFNTWRLNTNFAATVISNNAVTVSRAGSANRGGVAKGNGHISGTFTANELRTTTLRAGNTSSDGGFLFITSNTSVNATSLTVTANTTFQGNVDFVTSGTDRLVLGDISRVRVTGGTRGQFLRIEGSTDTPNFKSLTLRDITDLSSNSADIILSGSNSTFSDNGDSPAIKFADVNGNSARIFMAADAVGDADLHIVLADAAGDSTLAITDSSNTVVGYIDSAGNIVAKTAFLPTADDTVDLGSSGAEFKDAYIDGVAYIDELSMGISVGQGVATSLIPKTDAVGNLGSTNRKWGTLFADTTNGGAGIFNTVGVSSTLTVNGTATFNGGFNLTGNVDIGDQVTDTVTITAQVDSDFDPQTGTQRSMGDTANRWHEVYANNVIANNVTTDNNMTVLGDLTVSGTTIIASGQAFEADDGLFNTLGITGQFTANGNVDLGNAPTDTITATGQFDSDLVPSTDDTHDLGSATKQWQDLYIDGTASIDTLTVDETSTFTGDATFNGDNVTISGNVSVGDSLDVTDSIDFTNNLTNDGTVLFGSNGKLHANNTITNKTLTTSMLANTMTSSANVGSATQIPVISVNDRGQVVGISETAVAGVSGFSYTQSNNDLEISTATGTTFNATINPASTGTATKGVASFQAGDFSVSTGHVSLADSSNGAVLAINGTSNEVNVSRTNGTVTIGLPDDVTVTGQLNVGENIIISGNLIVQGTTTTVESETVRIYDNIIVLNSNESGVPSQNGGITIERGTSTNYSFVFDETSDRWTVGDRNLVANTFIGNVTGNITGDVDGTAELANTAVKLQTPRNIGISLSGDVTGSGSASFDGTGNITINAVNMTVQPDSVALGTDTTGNYMSNIVGGNGIVVTHTPAEGSSGTIAVDLDELATSNTNGDGDFFVVVDASGVNRKLTKANIDLSEFNTVDQIALGTDTTGNYMDDVVAGSGISVSHTPSEGSAATVSVNADQRGVIDRIGLDTDDYYDIDATQHRWYLDGAEDMRLTNNGQLDVEGSVVAHSATISDVRLKENVEQVTNAVEKVQRLNGYTFSYKKDGKKSAGVIAQEVANVLPSAVREHDILNGDGEYLIVEYDQLTALLIESIKELKAEIDDLKKNK